MIIDCEGCELELWEAYELTKEGLHLATIKGDMSENIGTKKHFGLLMVDDEGEVIYG